MKEEEEMVEKKKRLLSVRLEALLILAVVYGINLISAKEFRTSPLGREWNGLAPLLVLVGSVMLGLAFACLHGLFKEQSSFERTLFLLAAGACLFAGVAVAALTVVIFNSIWIGASLGFAASLALYALEALVDWLGKRFGS